MHRRRFLTSMGLGVVAASLLAACGGAASPTAKPAESKPAESKPAESKPAESKPAEAAKPAESKPAAPASGGADVPLFKDAKPLPANDPMAPVVDTMKSQLKNEAGASMTVDAYTLPSGATFDQVKTFYTDEMTKRGWKSATSQNAPAGQAGTGMVAWVKDDKSVVSVMVVPNPSQSGSSIMLIAKGTAK